MGTRDVILDAAAEVLRSRGLANATTKEIAKAAGFSEATLYKHFADKADLLVSVLRERSPAFISLGKALTNRAGQATVLENLTDIAKAAIAFYSANFPMLASIFSEPDILAAHRQGLANVGGGPHKAVEAVAAYLNAERERGRVKPDADIDAAAGLLMGACFQYAFLGHMTEPTEPHPAASAPPTNADTPSRPATAPALLESEGVSGVAGSGDASGRPGRAGDYLASDYRDPDAAAASYARAVAAAL